MRLPRELFAQVVQNAPLIAVDLVVRDPSGRVLLGLRNNEPARDFWFVPGGVIYKNERIAEAFSRVSQAELGVTLSIEKARQLGVYEHFYDTNFTGGSDFSTHYIVLGYEIQLFHDLTNLPTVQHQAYRWLSVEELLTDAQVHDNTKAYFR